MQNIRMMFSVISTVEKPRRDSARSRPFISALRVKTPSRPRAPRKYSNTRIPRRQPLGSVVTCPVIYGCNIAATLLFVVFTHISRNPAERERERKERDRSVLSKHRRMRSRDDIRGLKHSRDGKKERKMVKCRMEQGGWKKRRETKGRAVGRRVDPKFERYL